LLTFGLPMAATAQAASCADFDAWEWAQSVFESDPQTYDSLDPDGDGEACPDLPRGAFAPAFWTDCALMQAAGIPVLMFGADGGGAHAATEWTTIESVQSLIAILKATVAEFCS